MSNEQKKFFHLATYIPASFMVMFAVALGIYFVSPVYFTGTVSSPITMIIGIIMILLGSVVVLSAERVKSPFMTIIKSHHVADFMHGMYRISRHPTTLGSLIMFFGIGFVLNSFSFVLMGLVLFGMLSFIVMPSYENTMAALCSAYDDYRHKVRRWL